MAHSQNQSGVYQWIKVSYSDTRAGMHVLYARIAMLLVAEKIWYRIPILTESASYLRTYLTIHTYNNKSSPKAFEIKLHCMLNAFTAAK